MSIGSFFRGSGRKIVGGLSTVGRKILGSASDVGRKIIGGASNARDVLSKAYDISQKIPVVGGIVNKVVDTPLLGGYSIKDMANKASNALDAGQKAASGDVMGALDAGRKVVGLRKGGIVRPKLYAKQYADGGMVDADLKAQPYAGMPPRFRPRAPRMDAWHTARY